MKWFGYNSGENWTNAFVTFDEHEPDNGFRFITPHILDNNNSDRLWTGGNYIWRTNDKGQNWARASEAMSEGSSITAFGIANGDSDNVLVGTSRGFIVHNQDAGQTDSETQWHPSQPVVGNVSFNNETGAVSLGSIKGEHGNMTFTIVADDGQAKNDTVSQNISVTVEKKKSNGGTFGFLLIALASLFSRRLKK
ncbi:hypothetical protein CJF42_10450 [Pseudoalteromonas sp. NBT06-2]|nr:hypothetical protein CJF42_10450 [Pseudoalteromonas sp. NBT06-2]